MTPSTLAALRELRAHASAAAPAADRRGNSLAVEARKVPVEVPTSDTLHDQLTRASQDAYAEADRWRRWGKAAGEVLEAERSESDTQEGG